MFMKKKEWYEAPEAEILDLRLEVSILSAKSVDGNGDDLDLDDPGQSNPWS